MLQRTRFYARQVVYNLTSGLFFWPALIIGLLSLLALGVAATLPLQTQVAWLFPGEAAAAQIILGTIASSMMTVVSVVYSILLVALSLASMQFSTRILHELVRDRTSQVTLGVFVGTFVYCLLLLRIVQSQPQPVVPAVGVGIAILLALGAMGQLVYFIHHIAHSIQANHLVDRIASDSEAIIDAVFPAAPPLEPPLPAGWEQLPRWEVISEESGYVQIMNLEELATLARRLHGVVQIRLGVGHFTCGGLPLVDVYAAQEPSAAVREQIAACFDLGPVRTMQDDAEWGVRQLVDIALKAVSPAVNDPSTAVTCVDHIGRLLVRAARRHSPPLSTGLGDDGLARVVQPGVSLRTLLDLAITQIRQYSRGEMAVSLRLLRALERVATVVRDGADLARIALHARLISESVTAQFPREDCEELAARRDAVDRLVARGIPSV
jgi:uncharacterized membrane protein